MLVAGENVEPRLLAEVSTRRAPAARGRRLPPRRPAAGRGAAGRRSRSGALADPGNVGTLIRTADAFGAAVALSDGCADPTGPKALRASAGSIWRVPLLPFDAAPGGAGWRSSPRGGEPLGQVDLRGETTFLVGAEREGLPAELERDAEAWIPIGGAESLNAAVAGAIALYEWRRQNGPDA